MFDYCDRGVHRFDSEGGEDDGNFLHHYTPFLSSSGDTRDRPEYSMSFASLISLCNLMLWPIPSLGIHFVVSILSTNGLIDIKRDSVIHSPVNFPWLIPPSVQELGLYLV